LSTFDEVDVSIGFVNAVLQAETFLASATKTSLSPVVELVPFSLVPLPRMQLILIFLDKVSAKRIRLVNFRLTQLRCNLYKGPLK